MADGHNSNSNLRFDPGLTRLRFTSAPNSCAISRRFCPSQILLNTSNNSSSPLILLLLLISLRLPSCLFKPCFKLTHQRSFCVRTNPLSDANIFVDLTARFGDRLKADMCAELNSSNLRKWHTL